LTAFRPSTVPSRAGSAVPAPGRCVEGGTPTEANEQLEVRLLGPVGALRDGVPIDVGGLRVQTLLALLALRAGRPVSAELLADELWAGEPSEAALTTLRSYVSRLRVALGGDVTIERAAAGYLLALPSESVDSIRFERRVRDADALIEGGRQRRAADVLRAALTLWRGAPFAGLPNDGVLLAEATRLEELRLHAIEARIGAELESGRSGELVDELEGLVAANPFRERLWRHLMVALYRSGRQADALAAYHRAREALDEQLGIEPGVELRDLEAAILRQEVPAAGMHRSPSGALPVALTRFIGRRRELDEIHGLLGRARLLTLVGVGGVGKTRLAIEAAARELQDRADRVDLVDLAAVSDPSLVVDHVAASVAASTATTATSSGPLQAIREAVGTGDALLVLDNCEHVREATATLVQALLASSSDLRILATSRVALDIAGEAVYPVPPLTLAGAIGDTDGADSAAASEAVQLLLDRVTLTRHDLVLDDAAFDTAARIVRDLDGLPLAIELAAARIKALSLDEIADRLRDRFQFLVSWRRLTAARHRTLRETMDWSYELLDPDEQRLLARLSVFPAGATLASIAAVCLDEDLAEAERLVERLVDASLLVPVESERGTRYRQLETVRQYAAERLAPGETAALQRRLAVRVAEIAEATCLASDTRRPGVRDFVTAREELPAVRAAIAWALANDPALGVRIACGLESFWIASSPTEGFAIFSALLDRPNLPDASRARPTRSRGGNRYALGDYEQGVADYVASRDLFLRFGQLPEAAHMTLRLAIDANRVGDRERAMALLAESERMSPGERLQRDPYIALGLAAEIAQENGDMDRALELVQQEADLAAAADDDWWRSDSVHRRAEMYRELGRMHEAAAAALEALRLAHAIRDRQGTVYTLGAVARVLALLGHGAAAGRLWGGIEAEVARRGRVGQWELEAAALREEVAGIAGPAFEAGVVAGRALSLDDTIAEAQELGRAHALVGGSTSDA
jgi:predicted ATPase/DNA-binding SARP family transcriptional activator